MQTFLNVGEYRLNFRLDAPSRKLRAHRKLTSTTFADFRQQAKPGRPLKRSLSGKILAYKPLLCSVSIGSEEPRPAPTTPSLWPSANFLAPPPQGMHQLHQRMGRLKSIRFKRALMPRPGAVRMFTKVATVFMNAATAEQSCKALSLRLSGTPPHGAVYPTSV